jgi:hypothetical protein
MPNNNSSDAMRLGLETLAEAPIDLDEKQFFRLFFDRAWFIDSIVAYAIVHFGYCIRGADFARAVAGMVSWAEDSELFPESLNQEFRRVFLSLIVATAAKLMHSQKAHLWN